MNLVKICIAIHAAFQRFLVLVSAEVLHSNGYPPAKINASFQEEFNSLQYHQFGDGDAEISPLVFHPDRISPATVSYTPQKSRIVLQPTRTKLSQHTTPRTLQVANC